MNTTILNIKDEVHELIDTINDESVLKAVQTLLKLRYQDYELSDEQISELDRRMEDRKNGIGKSYTLNEVEAYFKNKKK